ncbi:acyl-ACP desaturase [Roseococcus sp. SDR]|uniref:acyl-ACP desaturase n=1 Tax=Roseococcus sp. SDR TaxID=2835532 RepID=UPI001BD0DD64|nr:acyl-ACP desaturase [Roseococcus sp. SDR]MBS7792562.1 acyl-ACP desaturase [Roseococcus sp. SDR]MBV1847876.1 acyl-ACP desaturase [Roseococcus sp. SDR]
MKHWHIEQIAWDSFDPGKVEPEVVPLVKAAAMVERNGDDYAAYLKSVFHDDPDFQAAADNWAVEENQHGDALGRWAMLADPSFNYMESFARYRAGYKIDVKADASIRGSRTGELIARCMVETGTSSYYTALGEASDEPVLKQICRLIAADEYRHFKLFYDHMKRYLGREKLSFPRRLRVALGRVGETEDDELAFAFHCSNDPPGVAYEHARCSAGYMGRAMGYYRQHHIERSMGMIFKAIGLEPRGRMSDLAARGAWRLLCWRREKFRQQLAREAQPIYARAA